MKKRNAFLTCFGGAAGGALPGMLIGAFFNERVGVAVAALGAFAGALLTLPGVSVPRTLKLFVAVIIARNLPVSDRIYHWVDRDSNVADDPLDQALIQWLLGADVKKRRGWLVLGSLVAGLLIGAAISVHDVLAIEANRPGYMLPFAGSRDSLRTQGVLLLPLVATWTASAVALIAAPAYRRAIFLGVVLGGCFGFAIEYASATDHDHRIYVMAIVFATFAAGFAMLVAAIGPPEYEQNQRVPEDEEYEE